MTEQTGSIGNDAMRKVLRGWFTAHAEEKGLSMRGEDTDDGFIFYSAETKAAWGTFIMGYMAGRADVLNAKVAQ